MTPDLARILVSPDPRGIAERLLRYSVDVLKARGGAVLQLQRPRILAFVTVDIELERLADARAAWMRGAAALEAGQPVACLGAVLLPLLLAELLVGAVFLEGITEGDLGEVSLPLAAALAAPAAPQRGLQEALTDMTSDELQREHMLVLLQNNEWNVARVARLMRCTRRTVYQRLERWGITRQRISKSPRRRRPAMA